MSDSPQGTLALARTAAGAVRSLNHATLGGDGLARPAGAYEVPGELSLAAAGLPQLLGQVGRWPAAVSGAWLFISGARGSAAALARDLGNAQQQQLAAAAGGPSQEEEP